MKTFILVFLLFPIAALAQKQHPYRDGHELAGARLFGENIISTPDRETGGSFSPDGKRIYFAKWSLDFKIAVICYSDFKNGNWQEPVIAPFSGMYHEQHPFVTPDGKSLYFISSRPYQGKRSGFRIWKAPIRDGGIGEPLILDESINRPGYSNYTPTLTTNGTLVFCQKEAGKGTADVYIAPLVDGKYRPEKIKNDTVNSDEFNEWHSYISPNGKILVFTSEGRPDGKGKEDLYIAYDKSGTWSDVRNLGEKINSGDHDYLGFISPDSKYFFFSSIRVKTFEPSIEEQPIASYTDFISRIRSVENGQPNLYQIDINQLNISPNSLK